MPLTHPVQTPFLLYFAHRHQRVSRALEGLFLGIVAGGCVKLVKRVSPWRKGNTEKYSGCVENSMSACALRKCIQRHGLSRRKASGPRSRCIRISDQNCTDLWSPFSVFPSCQLDLFDGQRNVFGELDSLDLVCTSRRSTRFFPDFLPVMRKIESIAAGNALPPLARPSSECPV